VFGHVLRGTNVLEQFNGPSRLFLLNVTNVFPRLPVLSSNPGFEDLVYTDISLLSVQVSRGAAGGREISWRSISNKVNQVEFSNGAPPVWNVLVSTNGTGQTLRITDTQPADSRLYRVTVQY